MLNSAKAVVAAVTLFGCVSVSGALSATLTATTPFTSSKVTDASGAVTYRIGAVFAGQPASERLSLTIICAPGSTPVPLSLLLIRTNVPAGLGTGPANLRVTIDATAPQALSADRLVANGNASYAVKGSADSEKVVASMANGKQLSLEVDAYAADFALGEFASEFADLTRSCPHR